MSDGMMDLIDRWVKWGVGINRFIKNKYLVSYQVVDFHIFQAHKLF